MAGRDRRRVPRRGHWPSPRACSARGVRFGDRVAIMSRTRYEWTLFDFALWTIGAQVVPVCPHVLGRAVLLDAPRRRGLRRGRGARGPRDDPGHRHRPAAAAAPAVAARRRLRAGTVRRRGRTWTTRRYTGTGRRSPPTRSPPSSTPPAQPAAPRAV
ncbi:hypothetical protein LT493_22435 [Streptomyces tricolor]|nr:hypothetical protein [Streptomyces tricolor]